MAEVERLGRSSFWSQFGPAIFVTLVLFTGFYVAALVLRRRPAAHKRLMIVASVAGMGAAAFRILVAIAGPVGWAAPVGVLATNLFIVWEMLCDRWRDGRVHPVYRIGFLTCVVAEAGTVHFLTLDQMRGAISELGFTPRQRNVRYQLVSLDHERLAQVLKQRKSKWLLCYNDTSLVRRLYEGWTTILPVSWSYGMNATKTSNEILIFPRINEVPPGTSR
jgi:hypothetical protein